MDNELNWYVIHTRSNFENVVSNVLAQKSFNVFLPKIKVKSRRRDRNVILNSPLFPGYVFVNTLLSPDTHLNILKTVGVVRLIGTKKEPIPVPDDRIDALKIMLNADVPVFTGTQFKEGDPVLVIKGPFKGIEGIFSRHGKEGRIIIYFETLGQFAAVEVDEEHVERIPDFG